MSMYSAAALWMQQPPTHQLYQPTPHSGQFAVRASALPTPHKEKSPFPLSFELNGGAYLFQPQSGCFYDPVSYFYYCPKSKLYYSSIEGTYYKASHSASSEVSYDRFIPPLPFDTPATSAGTIADAGDATVSRKPLVMSLGSKAGGTGGSKQKQPKIVSKVEQDMTKWTERQKELNEQLSAPLAAAAATAVTTASSSALGGSGITGSDEEAGVVELKIPSVVKANDVIACLICRRKFATAEQLIRHEKESKLHEENVLKLKNASSTEQVYRDRASERRAIHGGSDIPIVDDDKLSVSVVRQVNIAHLMMPTTLVSTTSTTDAVSTRDANAIPADNQGNILLKRLGWAEGAGLGRDRSGVTLPIGLDASKRGTAGLGNASDSGVSGGGGSSAAYIGSVKSAARARYDKMSGKEG